MQGPRHFDGFSRRDLLRAHPPASLPLALPPPPPSPPVPPVATLPCPPLPSLSPFAGHPRRGHRAQMHPEKKKKKYNELANQNKMRTMEKQDFRKMQNIYLINALTFPSLLYTTRSTGKKKEKKKKKKKRKERGKKNLQNVLHSQLFIVLNTLPS
ncbi:hypothetical protein PUN28_016677 [Cardiocondyla obscurior]|uniref:Uncharacterized protein n=1 Tax=Cardiocondyla obscurior TaxID=286306 RepID=A0AAW2EU32_9HYME